MSTFNAHSIDDLAGAFTDPLIVFDTEWARSLPDWIRREIPIARLLQQMKNEPDLASELEAMAYLYTASLQAPLDRDWTDIYCFLCVDLMKKRGSQVPEDVAPQCLSQYQRDLLTDLRRFIRNQQRRHRAGSISLRARQGQDGAKQRRLAKLPARTAPPEQGELFEP